MERGRHVPGGIGKEGEVEWVEEVEGKKLSKKNPPSCPHNLSPRVSVSVKQF